MEGTLCRQVRDIPAARESFFRLAQEVFGLSFRSWYEAGFWSERYLPYSFLSKGRVVSNISVNRIDLLWQGRLRRYIQLGTVMTDPAYRGRGLSRRLMETVLAEWQGRCDALYLFANDSVLDFYPKFGFIPAREHRHSLPVLPRACAKRRLDMALCEDRALLHRYYRQGNPYSAFPFLDNFELLMFYCTGPLRGCAYLLLEQDAVLILQQEGETLHCLDIYGGGGVPLQDLLNAAAEVPAQAACLGFTPKEPKKASVCLREEEDETLFLLSGKENLFAENALMFPLLSHA